MRVLFPTKEQRELINKSRTPLYSIDINEFMSQVIHKMSNELPKLNTKNKSVNPISSSNIIYVK